MSIEDNQSPEEIAAQAARQQASINSFLPPDGLELLNDPRVEPWRQKQTHRFTWALSFKPAEPVRRVSSYLKLDSSYGARTHHNAAWVNKPDSPGMAAPTILIGWAASARRARSTT